MNTEIYSLATCPGTKYSGDTITLRATPRDGIGPYYVAFKKDGIIIDPSRLGGESNPITNAPENVEIIRTYTLDDVDVSNALTGTIDFSVFIRGSCPTGGGLQFDGVNDYVDAGNGASLNITNSITISAWIKPTSFSSYMSWVYRKNTITSTAQWRGTFGTGSNQWGITWNDGSWRDYWTTDTIPLNSWSHTVIAVDKQNSTINLYRNGINVGSFSSVNVNFQDSTGVVFIGRQLENNLFFNGTIDEVRIYNRALSPTEVLGLYNGSTPRNGLVLEHIYSLGNANDLSGYGNNGTPINGPVFIPNACMDTCTVAIGCIAPVCNFVVT